MKPKPVASGLEADMTNGIQKTLVKRRPLPSDPVTGQAPSPSVNDDIQTPPRHKPGVPVTYPPKQSPMQYIEHSSPQPSNRFSRSQTDLHSYSHSAGSQYSTPPPRQDYPYQQSADQDDNHSPYEEQVQYHTDSRSYYEVDPRRSYHNLHEHYESPSPPPPAHHQPQLDEEDGPPPPPPVHRVRNNSGTSHELVHRGHDIAQQKSSSSMRYDVLRNEAHRLSITAPPPPSSSYPGRPTYRPYESAPDVQVGTSHHGGDPNLAAAPRHHSYESTYDSHYRSMQPTVEDVPESWTPPKGRTSISGLDQYDERDYQLVPGTAPLGLGGRGRDASGHHAGPVPIQNHGRHDSGSISPGHTRDFSYSGNSPSQSYTHQHGRYLEYPSELDNTQIHSSDNHAMHPVPATLVPGVDPSRAREISERLHEERRNDRRYTQAASVTTQTRGRQHSEPPTSNYSANYSAHNYQSNNLVNTERSLVAYSGGRAAPPTPPAAPRNRGLSPSPNPNHTIKRKSLSPAPPPAGGRNDGRRLSGVPFGPDSYDELNPVVAAAKDSGSNSAEYTNSDGKIVTPDGREVDPSDHLPMESWAPEPEPKKSSAPTESRSRNALSGAQPMPPSGRRPLRVTVRPQSTAGAPAQTYATPEVTPSPPASAGRNRLQKKQHRMSALPALMSSGPNPLGPTTTHQRNTTPPRALVRAGTFDYENYDQPSYGAPRSGHGNAPPIPAKVPMMSGGLGPMPGQDHRGTEDWALMEEMSRIDIGTGRARRHITYHP